MRLCESIRSPTDARIGTQIVLRSEGEEDIRNREVDGHQSARNVVIYNIRRTGQNDGPIPSALKGLVEDIIAADHQEEGIRRAVQDPMVTAIVTEKMVTSQKLESQIASFVASQVSKAVKDITVVNPKTGGDGQSHRPLDLQTMPQGKENRSRTPRRSGEEEGRIDRRKDAKRRKEAGRRETIRWYTEIGE